MLVFILQDLYYYSDFMKKEAKKQLFALIVLFLFVGSGLSFAFISAFTPEEKEDTPLMYDRLLSNQEEAEFLQKNMVVIRFFLKDDCPDCEEMNIVVNEVFQELRGRMIIEKLDMDYYWEEAERLEIDNAPHLYLKGNTIEEISGVITTDELITKLCELYFEPIEDVTGMND